VFQVLEFRYAHERYFNSDFMRKTYKRELFSDKPHNAYLEMLDTQGAVGVVAYVFLIAMLAWFLIRSAKDEKSKWFVVSMAGLLAAYLLNNFILFDTNMSYLFFFLIVAWFVSRDAAIIEGEVRAFPEWSGYRTIAAIMGLAIFVLAAVLTIMQGTKLRVVLKEMYAPLESRIGMYAKSEKVSPYGTGLSFGQRADVYANNYLAHMNEIVASDAATQKLVLADIDAIKVELENKFARFPKTAQAAMAYGRLGSARIAVLNTLDPVGLKMMRDGGSMMMALSPNNPQGYWILAQAYAYEGKFAEAKELLRKALDLNPRIPESYQIMIEFAKMSNDPKLLQEMMVEYSQNVLPEDR
jgi:tetratricopeptide (TPR) repeat protein